jgi:hypothetical protein
MSNIRKIAFEQPLFQSERIAGDWKQMRSQITSATQLEVAYKAVEPEVSALRLNLNDADAQQLLELYNKTVTDGRYLRDLIGDPAGVAAKLNVSLSASAAEAMKRIGTMRALQTALEEGGKITPYLFVAVVVIAIVVVIAFGPGGSVVVDSSGIVKI